MAFTYVRKSNPGVIPALQVIPAKAAVRRLGITFLSKGHSGQAVKAQGTGLAAAAGEAATTR